MPLVGPLSASLGLADVSLTGSLAIVAPDGDDTALWHDGTNAYLTSSTGDIKLLSADNCVRIGDGTAGQTFSLDGVGGGASDIGFREAGTLVARLRHHAGDNALLLGVGANVGTQFILTDLANVAKDHAHPDQPNPTYFIHADAVTDGTDNLQWLSLHHNASSSFISSGKGDIVLQPTYHTATGSVFVSGSLKAELGLSGSLTKLIGGTSYLVAGANITVTSASNGQISIASTGGGVVDGSGAATRLAYWSDSDTLTSDADLTFDGTALGVSGSLQVAQSIGHIGEAGNKIDFTTGQILILSGGAPTSPDESTSTDVNFFVSGSTGYKDGARKGAVVFGGDTVISGALYVSTPGVGQDVTFYGEDSSAIGLQWDADSDEHGRLILGQDNHGVDFKVFGETSSKYLHWDQSSDTFYLWGSLNTRYDQVFDGSSQGWDFTVNSNSRVGVFVDGSEDQVYILSGGSGTGATSPNPANATDLAFFVSGTVGSRGTSTKGTAVFGGDVHISGNITSDGSGLSAQWGDAGSILYPADGASENVGVGATSNTATDYDIYLSSDGAAVFNEQGASVDFRVESANFVNAILVDGSANQVLIHSGGSDKSANVASNVSFFVSGSVTDAQGKAGGGAGQFGVSLFRGDVVNSGSIYVRGEATTDKHIRIWHDGTDAYITASSGDIKLNMTDDLWIGDNETGGHDINVNVQANNTARLIFLNASNQRVLFGTNFSQDQTMIAVQADGGRQLILTDFNNSSKDHDHPVPTDPTFFVQSATDPDTDNTQWVSLHHNVSSSFIESGKGDIVFQPTYTAGQGAVAISGSLKLVGSDGDYVKIWHDGTNAYLTSSAGSLLILSGGDKHSLDSSTFTDTNFFVSGTIGSKNSAVKGTAVFGGDVTVSGTLHGSGSSTGAMLTVGSSTSVSGAIFLQNQSAAPNTSGGEGVIYSRSNFLFFKNSGGSETSLSHTPGGDNTQIQFNDSNAFNGDAGLIYNKSSNDLCAAGVITGSLGLSGSLTRLTDGRSYLVAGSSITITSESNGQILITGGGSCFVAGTKVSVRAHDNTVDYVNIENIKVNDSVLSFNLQTEQVEEKPVLRTMQPIHDDIVEFVFSDGTMTRHTFDHPYYVLSKGWASYVPSLTIARYNVEDLKETAQIEIGDKCVTHNRNLVTLIEINEIVSDNIVTYNFYVADNSNYFADGILVHNKPHKDYADPELEDDIVPIEDTYIDNLLKLETHAFEWNEKASKLAWREEGGSFGLTVEDVEQNFDGINFAWEDPDSGYKRLAYWKFIPLLIEGFKRQTDQIDELKALVAKLAEDKNE